MYNLGRVPTTQMHRFASLILCHSRRGVLCPELGRNDAAYLTGTQGVSDDPGSFGPSYAGASDAKRVPLAHSVPRSLLRGVDCGAKSAAKMCILRSGYTP